MGFSKDHDFSDMKGAKILVSESPGGLLKNAEVHGRRIEPGVWHFHLDSQVIQIPTKCLETIALED